MSAPGLETDRFVRASFAVERRQAGFTIVETPQRRDYWFGNCLILDRSPEPAQYDPWLARHAAAFAGTGAGKRVVKWETSGERNDPERPARGEVEFDISTVLLSDATPAPPARRDVAVRAVAGDGDWAEIERLERAEAADAPPNFADFYAWRTRMVRADVARGVAQVYGAFGERTLLAFAGCYARAEWIRLTTPVTANEYRRRGLFSTLFALAVGAARERFPAARVVVVAETDSAPERLYRSLGFAVSGYQYALVE
jgi:hypothetical protein